MHKLQNPLLFLETLACLPCFLQNPEVRCPSPTDVNKKADKNGSGRRTPKFSAREALVALTTTRLPWGTSPWASWHAAAGAVRCGTASRSRRPPAAFRALGKSFGKARSWARVGGSHYGAASASERLR